MWDRTIAIYINVINIEGKLIRTIFKGLMSLFALVIWQLENHAIICLGNSSLRPADFINSWLL